MLSSKIKLLVDLTRKLLHRDAIRSLKKILEKIRPQDISFVMRHLDSAEQLRVFELIDDIEIASQVVAELDEQTVSRLLPSLGVKKTAEILHRMPADDVADIVEVLPEEFAETLFPKMKAEDVEEVEELMKYGQDTAGGIMSPDAFYLSEDTTAGEAISTIQREKEAETVFYIYVVDEYDHLVGVMSLRKLLLVSPDTRLVEIMERNPVRVQLNEDQEEVARIVSRYNFLSIPVVDENNKLEGVITVDDVIDVMRDEATEDILLMAGAEKDAIEQKSIWHSIKSRMPWLLITLVGEGILAAEVIMRFNHTLTQVVALAGFIPVIIALGGNVGLQSMTIMVRGLSTGRINISRLGYFLRRELVVSIILGFSYAILVGIFAYFRHDSFFMMPLAIGLSIMFAMMMAAIVGTLVPMLFERVGIDPAVATGPFVTVTIDVLGILVYFSIATALLKVFPI